MLYALTGPLNDGATALFLHYNCSLKYLYWFYPKTRVNMNNAVTMTQSLHDSFG